MKKIFYALATVALCLGLTSNAYSDDKKIDYSALPQNAKAFIDSTFSGIKVNRVKMDVGDGDYEVILKGGIEIDFRSNGEWESVKSRDGVPASCVPTEVSNYVKANYPNRTIVKISRKKSGNVEIELGGIRDLELLFDANGKFIRIDD